MISKKKKTILLAVSIIVIFILLTSFIVFLVWKNKQNKPETIFQNQDVLNQIIFSSDEGEGNQEGVIGYLTIESIGLNQAPIKEGTDMEILNEFIGHFSDSNYLEGNVALAGHNRGYDKNYFENLKNLKGNEIIVYQTKSETKTYKVTEIKKVSVNDVSVIEPTEDNRITLVTCVENNNNLRLVIIGSEI